jgi:hypothetical protein
MRNFLLAARLAVLPVALSVGFAALAPAPAVAGAKVGSQWVEGTLVHISTDNIKIKTNTPGQQILGFAIVPHFDQIFSSDGKTTYQMKSLHSGQLIKIYYDQKFLGMRHADRILVLTRMETMKKMQKG